MFERLDRAKAERVTCTCMWSPSLTPSLRLAAALRLHNGASAALRRRAGSRPAPELVLYEYEASPFCRRVRETLCVLGLGALVLPCPRETLRAEGAFSPASPHRAAVQAQGGRLSFPYLVDRTAGVALNDSRAICEHLWRHYGEDVERPWRDWLLNGGGALPRPLEFALLVAPSGVRPLPAHGLLAAAARQPGRPLQLRGCEPDPESRLVREALCSLQLPYEHTPLGASDAPPPVLIDRNEGVEARGAADALAHLDETYRLGPSLSYAAGLPEPNLGDSDRTSWLTTALSWLPPT